MTHFEGPSVWVKTIERPLLGSDVDIGNQRVDPMTTTCGEGAMITIYPVLTLLPPFLLVLGLFSIPREFLQ